MSRIKLVGFAALILMGGICVDRWWDKSHVEPPATIESISDEYDVSIRVPGGGITVYGVTVFLPGTSILGIGPNLESYESTINVLLEMNQLVIGFNRLRPSILHPQMSHDKMAERVRDVVAAIRDLGKYPCLVNKEEYSIVGHSLGGKVALMVAAKFDVKNIIRVIALDPVDEMDPQFTTTPPMINLGVASARIYLRQSAQRGYLTPSDGRNAAAIRNAFPHMFEDDFQVALDAKAYHMSYTDETNDASVETRKEVHASIRMLLNIPYNAG
jgi:pimeloyl-ACP methyl ester carboxylesterase